MVLCTASRFRRLIGQILFLRCCLDVNLVRIYLCIYYKGYGRKNRSEWYVCECQIRCIVRSDKFTSICKNTCKIAALTFFFFTHLVSTFFIFEGSPSFAVTKPKFVLDSIAMYRNRVVVYILAY